jgi:hypothetical protein
MPVKRYDGTDWVTVAGEGVQGPTGPAGASATTVVTTKGDLLTYDTTAARLAVGANDTILIADSTAATGLAWKTATTQFPWQAWTPTLTNITLGNGTIVARYQQIGKTVNFEVVFTMGSTSAMGSTPQVSMPVTPARYVKAFPVQIVDEGTGLIWGNADTYNNKFYITSTVVNATFATADYLSSTSPMTWTTSDKFSIYGTYEAA